MNRKTIMIVEDEPLISLDLREVLEAAGCLVLEASDEREALSMVAQHLPDMAILNFKSELFPDGMALARMLYTCHSTKVLFITGADPEGLAASADFDAKHRVLQKPFTRRQLKRFVFPEKFPPFPESWGMLPE